MDFATAKRLFQDDDIPALSEDADGLRFLKLRSLSRKELLQELFTECVVAPVSDRADDMFRQAFESDISIAAIEGVIRAVYGRERETRRTGEAELVSELYKMASFDWGGLHQNSLEKTIVDNYVKRIKSYDVLESKIENELHNSMRGFVLCQWYNHWTSIVIEDIFRDHLSVLPAVGQVKKIDFFVHDVPYDLKVTYFPEGYIKECRKDAGLRPEITLLKGSARALGIHYDGALPEGRLLEDLWQKHRDHPASEARSLTEELESYRLSLLAAAQADSSDLIRWLYENQGVRRFDASNRLFLILVDQTNLFGSWQLKRARPLLEERINSYLDCLDGCPGKAVQFDWEGQSFRVVSDVVFVVHD